MTQFIQNSKLL